jgi:hypothetical protein
MKRKLSYLVKRDYLLCCVVLLNAFELGTEYISVVDDVIILSVRHFCGCINENKNATIEICRFA